MAFPIQFDHFRKSGYRMPEPMQVVLESRNIFPGPAVVMETDRPDAERHRPKLPELLRDPGDAAIIDMRKQKESVADHSNPEVHQDRHGVFVKRMSRRYPHRRRDVFAAKNLDSRV